MRRFFNAGIWVIFVLLFSLSAFAGEHRKNSYPWELKKNRDGIKVFIRKIADSDFKEFMGVMVVDAPVDKLNQIVGDVPNQKNWMCDMLESKSIKDDPKYPIQYNVIKAPIVSNRDVLLQVRVVQSPKRTIRYFHAIKLSSLPPRKGIVRMPKMSGFWSFEKLREGKTRVVYQNLAEPGGSLPSWLVNMTVVKQPFVTLQGLRKQLNNPKFR